MQLPKAAVNHLTRLMAKFLAPRHIAVNGIAPGYFPSKMTAGLGEVGLSEVAEAAPMKRTGSPDDIAGIALYLACPSTTKTGTLALDRCTPAEKISWPP